MLNKTIPLIIAQVYAMSDILNDGSTFERKVCNSDDDCAPAHVCVMNLKGWQRDMPESDISGKGCAPKVVCSGTATWDTPS